MKTTYRDVCSHKTGKPLGLVYTHKYLLLLEDFNSKMESLIEKIDSTIWAEQWLQALVFSPTLEILP